jgi:hypothetical protein
MPKIFWPKKYSYKKETENKKEFQFSYTNFLSTPQLVDLKTLKLLKALFGSNDLQRILGGFHSLGIFSLEFVWFVGFEYSYGLL